MSHGLDFGTQTSEMNCWINFQVQSRVPSGAPPPPAPTVTTLNNHHPQAKPTSPVPFDGTNVKVQQLRSTCQSSQPHYLQSQLVRLHDGAKVVNGNLDNTTAEQSRAGNDTSHQQRVAEKRQQFWNDKTGAGMFTLLSVLDLCVLV